MSDAREQTLIQALRDWVSDCEGSPGDPSDARLLKAFVTYDGDHTEPCEECDGNCGEPCAPYTVAGAHRALDRFIEDWNKRHGIIHGAES